MPLKKPNRLSSRNVLSRKTQLKRLRDEEAADFNKDKDQNKDKEPSESEEIEEEELDLNEEELEPEEDQEDYFKKQRGMKRMLDTFTEEQLERYEVYRRSQLPKPAVKKLITQFLGQTTVHVNIPIIVSGVAKLFIGELTEKAIEVANKWGDLYDSQGYQLPLRIEHINEAYRIHQKEISKKYPKTLFI